MKLLHPSKKAKNLITRLKNRVAAKKEALQWFGDNRKKLTEDNQQISWRKGHLYLIEYESDFAHEKTKLLIYVGNYKDSETFINVLYLPPKTRKLVFDSIWELNQQNLLKRLLDAFNEEISEGDLKIGQKSVDYIKNAKLTHSFEKDLKSNLISGFSEIKFSDWFKVLLLETKQILGLSEKQIYSAWALQSEVLKKTLKKINKKVVKKSPEGNKDKIAVDITNFNVKKVDDEDSKEDYFDI